MTILLAASIGFVAGLRAMTAPAAASWAAHLGWIDLSGSWLAFLGYAWTPWIFTSLAAIELITDQLPSAPSRKVPIQFGTRLIMGALSGAALSASTGSLLLGGVVGLVGAVAGTFAGAAIRARLAAAFRRDLPAALIEDGVAVGGAALIVGSL